MAREEGLRVGGLVQHNTHAGNEVDLCVNMSVCVRLHMCVCACVCVCV